VDAILENQTLALVIFVAFVTALADFASGTIGALRSRTFDLAHLADWGSTHLLAAGGVAGVVILAIFAAFLDAALAATPDASASLRTSLGLATDGAWVAAIALLVSYVGTTLASFGGNLGEIASGAPSTAPPAATSTRTITRT
jgi:hypothetical protein